MPTDLKYAFHRTRIGTLVIGSQDLFFLLFGIPTPRIEHTALVTILAPELLAMSSF